MDQSAQVLKADDVNAKEDNKQTDLTLRKQLPPVSFFALFRFADGLDKALMIIGTISAMAAGAAMPAFSLLWGNMTNAFAEGGNSMVETAKGVMFNFLEIGAGVFVASWLMFACWMIAGERQAIRCRKLYLNALLSQEIGWFDLANQTEMASRFAAETFAFQGAIGEKVATFIMTISMTIAGFIIAYIKGWQLALVVTAAIPALALTGMIYITILQTKDQKTAKSYAEAGGKAEEAIGAMKTVKSLNGENYEVSNFTSILSSTVSKSFKYSIYAGIGIGSIFFSMLACYALGFWYGAKLVNEKVVNSSSAYTSGDVLVIFFSIMMGGFNLSQVTPCLKKFAEGQQSAARIFAIMDRKPRVSNSPNAKTLPNLVGVIKFHNVSFAYPKEPQRMILRNLNLELKPNQTNALVGESGCGKSTVMQLLMRFYDPLEGSVTLDGVDLRDIDLTWLRENIGYVGQEPVLFATSIRENMLFGKPGATDEEIIEALKKAEAWDFVAERGLDSYVGYGGGQLSGGQKQRIAIARAVLKNPRILLLDQATSALDRKNEILIQKTLDSITTGRTTITIAHRVKTIMNAEQIVVIDKGSVLEFGRFRELNKFKDYEVPVDQNQNATTMVMETGKKEDLKEAEAKANGDIPLTKEEKEKKEQQELLKKHEDQVFKRLFEYTKPDIWLFILGILSALGNGTIFPIFSLFLAKMIGILIELQQGYDKISEANYQALVFFILSLAGLVANALQISLFSIVGDRITMRLRIDCFNKIIRMPVPWFDIPRNNAGSLTARLATDCQQVNGLTTNLIGITFQNISCLVTGIIIAFIYEWRISLVTFGLIPFMLASGVIQMKMMVGFSAQTDEAYKDSANLIMEAMVNIRTVTSFGVENSIANKYSDKLDKPYQLSKKKGNVSGLLFGLSQLIMFIIFALIFYIGTLFVRDCGVTFTDLFTAIYAIMFAAMTAGNNTQFMPDVAASKNSAANLFQILDGQDEDQIQVKSNSPALKTGGQSGAISAEGISFRYPTASRNTFTNLSLKIEAGHKVAMVGPSGCGKSTIIQMLMRFYEPTEGRITLEGRDLKEYDIHYLRSLFGIVSQEPVLFNASFKQNVQYNKDDATFDQIYEACRKANALSFIEGEEKENGEAVRTAEQSAADKTAKFDRGVGVKGGQISGGQKQRVAIARAILRKPEILLLDEATSALDSNNEKKVQDSLDSIMGGHTTISIAHRLDTIKNSNTIFVFDSGEIVESGNWDDLIAKKGAFYKLERGHH